MSIVARGKTDTKRKRALLVYQAGQRVREVFKQLEDTGNDTDYDTAKANVKGYFGHKEIADTAKCILSNKRNKNKVSF